MSINHNYGYSFDLEEDFSDSVEPEKTVSFHLGKNYCLEVKESQVSKLSDLKEKFPNFDESILKEKFPNFDESIEKTNKINYDAEGYVFVPYGLVSLIERAFYNYDNHILKIQKEEYIEEYIVIQTIAQKPQQHVLETALEESEPLEIEESKHSQIENQPVKIAEVIAEEPSEVSAPPEQSRSLLAAVFSFFCHIFSFLTTDMLLLHFFSNDPHIA